jgi:hypothetical protein
VNAIEMLPGSLQCDAPSCGYVTEEKVSPADLSAWLERPCPKCGAPLLTEAGLEFVMILHSLAGSVNEVTGPVPDGAPRMIITIKQETK